MRRPTDDRLMDRTYSLSEAARFIDASPNRIRRWVQPERSKGPGLAPVFEDCRRTRNEPLRFSFLDLAEMVVANHLRCDGWSNADLAELRRTAARELDTPHPLATEQAQQVIAVQGRDVRRAASPAGLGDALREKFDYDWSGTPSWAIRYFPRGRGGHLVIEPGFGSGRVTMISCNLLADVVAGRYFGGDQIDFIAEDYALSEDAVRAAISYAGHDS